MSNAPIRPYPKKIAVLHAKALGDLIVTLPAIAALKKTFPQSEITLLAKPWVKDFLNNRQGPIDRVIAIPPYPGVHDVVESKGDVPAQHAASTPEIEVFFSRMQAESFDLAIHLHGDGKSANPFLNKLGATVTAGMKNAGAEEIDRSIPYVHYQSEVIRNLEVVALVGVTTAELEPRLTVTKSDVAQAFQAVPDIKDKPFAILHPGADDTRRLWPADKFAQAGDALAEQELSIVLTGTPKEEAVVTAVAAAMKHTAIPCTNLSLSALAGLLSKSSVCVSNDTGPLHLARAVGSPTVGIYWLPNVLNWGPLTRTNHRVAVSWQLACPACGIIPANPWPFQPKTPECDHPYSFVDSVAPREVITHALDLL